MKENDIYKWSWNEKAFNSKKLEQQSGTLYWCCSQIGIVKNETLVDTYWHSSGNKQFTQEFINDNLELEYVGNMDDLENVPETSQAMYLDKDCVNLNHPNNTRGNFYIRKGAKKNLDKMKTLLQRDINRTKSEIKEQLTHIKNRENQLKEAFEDMYLHFDKDFPLSDESWMDGVD